MLIYEREGGFNDIDGKTAERSGNHGSQCKRFAAATAGGKPFQINPFTTEPMAISLLLETDNLGIIH